MIIRKPSAVILLIALVACSPAISAQSAKTLSLEEILQRLQDNLRRYDRLVPSFFCDEHAISQVEPGSRNQNAVTDSIFRLDRTENPDHTTSLTESREIKLIDGKPATSQEMDGPALVSGAFEGGLAVVTLTQRACMNYSLQRPRKNLPSEPYIVRFATVLTPQNIDACLLQENSKGSISIDPASMQITHLELITQHHTIIPGTTYREPVIGKRVLTVDYVPVQFNDVSYWMPSTITSQSTSNSGTFHEVVWLFHATYRNYHKLEVESRILSPGEVPKQ
jgi:hypothetical protein